MNAPPLLQRADRSQPPTSDISRRHEHQHRHGRHRDPPIKAIASAFGGAAIRALTRSFKGAG